MSATVHDDCCERLAALVADQRVPVGYNPKVREWWLKILSFDPDGAIMDWRDFTAVNLLVHCPFCASKLPPSLRDEWFDLLAERGFENPLGEEDVPEEFRSDRWWKERGL